VGDLTTENPGLTLNVNASIVEQEEHLEEVYSFLEQIATYMIRIKEDQVGRQVSQSRRRKRPTTRTIGMRLIDLREILFARKPNTPATNITRSITFDSNTSIARQVMTPRIDWDYYA